MTFPSPERTPRPGHEAAQLETPQAAQYSQCLDGDREASSDQRFRSQAICAYPLLKHLYYWDPQGLKLQRAVVGSDSGASAIREIHDAVDSGAPLNKVLQTVLRLAPWMVRYLRHSETAQLGLYASHLSALADDLRLLTPETAPPINRLPDLYEVLRSGCEAAPSLLRECLKPPLTKADVSLISRLVQDLGRAHQLNDYLRFLSHLREWAASRSAGYEMRSWLLRPELLSVCQLWSLSCQWHDIEAELRQSIGIMHASHPELALPGDINWPAIFPDDIEFGGYSFVCLTAQSQLDEESVAMRHCVGSYGEKCVQGVSHIISVRQEGRRVATIELQLSGRDDAPLKVREAAGYKNRRLSTYLRRLVECFLSGPAGVNMDTERVPLPNTPERLLVVRRARELATNGRNVGDALDIFDRVYSAIGLGAIERYKPVISSISAAAARIVR